MAFSLIAGLGNPESNYQATRHNMGFLVIDALAKHAGVEWEAKKNFKCAVASITLEGQKLKLIKPLDFMNNSGKILKQWADFYKIPTKSILVIFDDISFELGQFKLTKEGGPAGHNGIKDILNHLGSGFARFRIGIGYERKASQTLTDWVLETFSKREQTIIDLNLTYYLNVIQLILRDGFDQTANQINTGNHSQ